MSKPKAFTLIELLVVVSIIALLVAILMPALSNARRQATGAVCMSNTRSLSVAWSMYADDNNGRIVGGSTYYIPPYDSWVFPPQVSPDLDPLHEELEGIKKGKLFKYVNSYDVYHCPGDKRELRSSVTPRNPNGWLCFRSFGIIGTMNGEQAPISVKKTAEIRSPSEKLVFLEETDDRGWNMGSWIMNVTKNSFQWIDPLTIWHNKQGTLGFADGHSEMHRWEDERTLVAAEKQLFGENHPNSKDWLFMWRAYIKKN